MLPKSKCFAQILEFQGYEDKKRPCIIEGKKIKRYAYIVFEYASYGSVLRLLMKANDLRYKISDNLRRYIFFGLLKALRTLRDSCNLIHGDVKVDNVCISEDLEVVLIDFAHSHPSDTKLTSEVGTPCF